MLKRIIPVSVILIISLNLPFCGTATKSTLPQKNNWVEFAPNSYKSLPAEFQAESFKEITFEEQYIKVAMYATKFSRGNALYIEITEKEPSIRISDLQMSSSGKAILLHHTNRIYRGFSGIDLNYTGQKIVYNIMLKAGNEWYHHSYNLDLEKKQYLTSNTPLDLSASLNQNQVSKKEIEMKISQSTRKKEEALNVYNKSLIGNKIAFPVNSNVITSPFGVSRVYHRYTYEGDKKKKLKPSVSVHKGTDFRARMGDAIYSIAEGKVVLADELYFEGNCIIIDHGNRVFSSYFHLSKLLVKKGTIIKAGEVIGLAGDTGISTAPHLHLSVHIDSTLVDPLSFISLPVKE